MENIAFSTVKEVFEKQKDFSLHLRKSKAKERIAKLKSLKKRIEKYEASLLQALYADMRKNPSEALISEFLPLYKEIDHCIKHLKAWMRPKHIAASVSTLFGKSRVRYEPLGVTLIIAPWNYPFFLVFSPLVSAIAAGNTAIVKPSEMCPHTANIMEELIRKHFNPNEVFLVQGDVETTTQLLQLPFNHIFFTGSSAVGKIVMQAAAKNLSKVTLELGGKSPVIIDESANIKKAASKIMWAKVLNCGQTCIAPDYIFIHENVKKQFVDESKKALQQLSAQSSNDYAKIVNTKHYIRLQQLYENAVQMGAIIEIEATFTPETESISPAILSNTVEEMPLMQEEIFGPIIPLITYKKIDEVIHYINSKEKSLALYIFTKKREIANLIIESTSSGGCCVNDVMVNIGSPHLPFGGVNNSGIGNYHGIYGFKTFSHERAIFIQSGLLDFSKLLYPPYKGKEWIIKLLKWW
jgi:aldehyde dehydrogenase (NAD+)